MYLNLFAGRLINLRGPIRGLLLCTTKPELWRKSLRDFLNDYILEVPLKESLHFLEQMVGKTEIPSILMHH